MLVIDPILLILLTAFHMIINDTNIELIVINLLVKYNLPSKFNGRLYFDFGIILPNISNILSTNPLQQFFLVFSKVFSCIFISSNESYLSLAFKIAFFINSSLYFISLKFLEEMASFCS